MGSSEKSWSIGVYSTFRSTPLPSDFALPLLFTVFFERILETRRGFAICSGTTTLGLSWESALGELRPSDAIDFSLKNVGSEEGSSLERPLYLFFGSRSVNENKFFERRIVFNMALLSLCVMASMLNDSGKNFLERDSTIGKARI